MLEPASPRNARPHRRVPAAWLAGLLGVVLAAGAAHAAASAPPDTSAFARIRAASRAREWSAADSLGRGALETLRRSPGGDSLVLARAAALELLPLGRLHPRAALGDSLAALALGVAERRAAGAPLELADALEAAGTWQERSGHIDEAFALFDRERGLCERLPGSNDARMASALFHMAQQQVTMRHAVRADSLSRRALALRERALGTDAPLTALSAGQLGGIQLLLGRYAEGEGLLLRAQVVFERDSMEFAESRPAILGNLAVLEVQRGDLRRARGYADRAIPVMARTFGSQSANVAAGEVLLATIARQLGFYEESRTHYDRARALYVALYGPAHPALQAVYQGLEHFAEETGDYGRADSLLRVIYPMQLARADRDSVGLNVVLESMARVAQARGEPRAALPLLARSVALDRRRLGIKHPEALRALTDYGAALVGAGEPAAGLDTLDAALALLGPEGREPSVPVLTALLHKGTALRQLGRLDEAHVVMTRGLAGMRRTFGDLNLNTAIAAADMARLERDRGQPAAALRWALLAERGGRRTFQLLARAQSEHDALAYARARTTGIGTLLALAADGLPPAERLQAWDALQGSRALVLEELAERRGALRRGEGPVVDSLREAFASTSRELSMWLQRGEADSAAASERERARRARDQVEEALAASSAAFRSERARDTTSLAALLAARPTAAALVAFARYRAGTRGQPGAGEHDRYLAFVAPAGARSAQVVALGDAARIDGAIERWRGQVLAGARDSSAAGEARCRVDGLALRRLVWDPVVRAAGPCARVLLVPDGQLSGIAFGALPNDAGGYLAESGPLLHELGAERDLVAYAAPRTLGSGLLAVGGARFDAAAAGGASASGSEYRGARAACLDLAAVRFADLPGTRSEVEAVAATWSAAHAPGAATTLEADAASETAVKRSAAGHRVLHLATHGFFLDGQCADDPPATRGVGGMAPAEQGAASAAPPSEDALEYAGLALAGANQRASAGPAADDGILTAEEISALDLDGVEWAVLSGCDTGLGRYAAGEGVVGLQRAFARAGARTVIMSLWPVADATTTRWMESLYRAHLEQGLDTAASVRAAQRAELALRRRTHASTHPFFWAAFEASGDWR